MSTELTTKPASGIPALAMDENELLQVLENSLYPGAAVSSIKLVVSYCRASDLDPLQKPVHIVPIWDKTISKMRDVVMPGVGLYRTQAARSGAYAGMSEPEFGPDVKEVLAGVEVTYPKWCKVTVYRLLNGEKVGFPAIEFWKENYATAKKDTLAPNSMWRKRPYGQLNKCAEAQALRKAFPEVGAAPTADEMEGKDMDEFSGNTIDGATGDVVKSGSGIKPPKSKSQPPADGKAAAPQDAPIEGTSPRVDEQKAQQAKTGEGNTAGISAGQAMFIRKKAESAGRPEAELCAQFGVSGSSFDEANAEQWAAIKSHLTGA